MTESLKGKVAFITGAARGQGRSHAIRLAEEGADIIAVDICAQIDSVRYPLASSEDLATTAKEVEALGQRIVTREVDVRDGDALKAAMTAGVQELGRLDIVLANAGIAPFNVDSRAGEWDDVIGVNLSGVYNTVEAALPTLIKQGDGGAIVLTGSTASLFGVGANTPGGIAYTAAKHGLIGLMRAYANYQAQHSIRVNAVLPSGVRTDMVTSEAMQEYVAANEAQSRLLVNALPVELLEPVDLSNAIAFLVSDAARYVTGLVMPVDAGFSIKH
ncbi:SDR family mycofactocin-dependent oxidoreductase [Rhodococcus sp. 06-1059B-a]|nr:mycofactocin-coupled SDR family oxidoreductase [Rhodococcus sp. 06-1059B-a]OZD59783.1 SDR family mycofactocin-dependent oxidoreductase [Rhodococcus sp. 06-1059B-a]